MDNETPPNYIYNQNEESQRSTAASIASQIVVDWEVAQAILYVIQERTSLLIGRQLRLDEDVHIAEFHKLFLKDRLGFWTIIDQLHDYLLTLDWSRVLDDIALIQHLLKTLKPLPCPLTEVEFVQILLLKLWPQQASPPHSPQQQFQPQPYDAANNFFACNDFTSEKVNADYAISDATRENESAENAAESGMDDDVDPDVDDEEEERKLIARNEVIRLAVENVYTWEAVERIIELVNEKITAKVGRDIRFDQKHIDGLKSLYERDPLCFWSVFDQIQDKMMKSDWSKVRNDARFMQSFMNKYEPIDVLLTPFMADVIPQHSLVPKAYPPHVLYKKDMSTFKPIQKENCLYNSKYYRKQQMLHQQQQQQDEGGVPSPTASASTSSPSLSSQQHSSPQTQQPYPPCQHGHYNYFHNQNQQNCTKDSPKATTKTAGNTNRNNSFNNGNNGFGTNVNNGSNNFHNNGNSNGQNSPTMTSSPSSSQMRGLEGKSKQYQRVQQNNNGNNGNVNGVKQPQFVYTWNNALSAISEIESQVKMNFSSVDVVFEDCHRATMRARWEADPKGFFSVLDQIHTKFCQINWDTVTTKTKYINSIITKYEPQSVLSKFIQKFITPPDMAAVSARV